VSKRYDADDTRGDEEQTVTFLAQLARRRDALEFAVGTGRIALPLIAAGVHVDGIELSSHMVDRMREKPDGNLLTQDDQVRCFENAARRPLRHDPGTSSSTPSTSGWTNLVLDVCRYDPVTQILDENHVRIGGDSIVFSPIRLGLAHPPEFDLMARVAGLRLRERWGGWSGQSYTANSWRHVRVYERAVPLDS